MSPLRCGQSSSDVGLLAPSGSHPFPYGDNHLLLAQEAGLGTNRLQEIGVLGGDVSAVTFRLN